MNRQIFVVLFGIVLLAGCSKDWNIASSGLDNDNNLSTSNSGGDTSEEFGASDLPNNSTNPQDDISSSSGKSQYDPDATPPKITDPRFTDSPWREFSNAPIQNQPENRSAESYLSVLLQFDVAKSYPCRYEPSPYPNCKDSTTDTRCNIYASDVMSAMGVPLPTKGELGVGAAGSENTDKMPANAASLHDWLDKEQDGWIKLNPNDRSDWDKLMQHIAAGKPALASRSDHIAVIRPDQPENLSVGNIKGIHVAQAGATNSNDIMLGVGFGGGENVEIFIHE